MGRLQTISIKTVIFDKEIDGGTCTKFFIGCNPTSLNGVDIDIEPITQSGKPFPLYPDTGIEFEHGGGIRKVTVTPVGGDTIIDYGVVKR